MNTVTQGPTEAPKKRFGLIAAKIGATFAHKLLIEIPLEEPEYATTIKAPLVKSRTSLSTHSPHYAYTLKNGSPFPAKALPGATIQLTVQDLSRLDPALTPHVKWYCRHYDCKGHRHDSKEALIRSHPENRKLDEEARQLPYGEAHVYLAIIELPGLAEKRDDKTGKITQEGQLPTAMLLSDEE